MDVIKLISNEEKVEKLSDRVNEIRGQLNTLDFAMEIDKIDARLYRMKRKTLMYELELINEKLGQLKHDIEVDILMEKLNINTI